MRKLFLKLKKEYAETKSYPGEGFLEWFIHRKMTWGQRWILVIVLNFIIQPLIWNLRFLYWLFWIGSLLLLAYIIGQLSYVIQRFCSRMLKQNKHD